MNMLGSYRGVIILGVRGMGWVCSHKKLGTSAEINYILIDILQAVL